MENLSGWCIIEVHLKVVYESFVGLEFIYDSDAIDSNLLLQVQIWTSFAASSHISWITKVSVVQVKQHHQESMQMAQHQCFSTCEAIKEDRNIGGSLATYIGFAANGSLQK